MSRRPRRRQAVDRRRDVRADARRDRRDGRAHPARADALPSRCPSSATAPRWPPAPRWPAPNPGGASTTTAPTCPDRDDERVALPPQPAQGGRRGDGVPQAAGRAVFRAGARTGRTCRPPTGRCAVEQPPLAGGRAPATAQSRVRAASAGRTAVAAHREVLALEEPTVAALAEFLADPDARGAAHRGGHADRAPSRRLCRRAVRRAGRRRRRGARAAADGVRELVEVLPDPASDAANS